MDMGIVPSRLSTNHPIIGEKKMKNFDSKHKQARQGDVLFTRIDTLPDGLSKLKDENGIFVLAHSETGHNHVMQSKDVELYANDNDPFVAYLVVNNEAKLEHMRSFDTHETINFKQGVYRINRQREYTPKGFRRAAD